MSSKFQVSSVTYPLSLWERVGVREKSHRAGNGMCAIMP